MLHLSEILEILRDKRYPSKAKKKLRKERDDRAKKDAKRV